MGWEFMFKIFVVVIVCGVLIDLLLCWVDFVYISLLYLVIVGGVLVGLGILFYICYCVSFGGIGILVVYLQCICGWSVGKVQMFFDMLLMCVVFFVLFLLKVMYLVIGVVVFSLVLMFNYCFGCYMGV